MSHSKSFSLGKLVGGQGEVICLPRKVIRRYMILATHGYGGNAWKIFNPVTGPGFWTLVEQLTAAGCVVVSHDYHGDSWGNDTGNTDIEAIRQLAANYGCDPAKVVFFGGSMGGLTIYNYIRDYGNRVAGASLVAPLANLNSYYANPDSTLGAPDIPIATQQGSIATAWGVTAPAALPARADPLTNAATIAAWGVPHTVYWADSSTNGLGDADDNLNPVIRVADVNAMKAAVGSQEKLVYLGNTPLHGDPETVIALNKGLANELIGWAA